MLKLLHRTNAWFFDFWPTIQCVSQKRWKTDIFLKKYSTLVRLSLHEYCFLRRAAQTLGESSRNYLPSVTLTFSSYNGSAWIEELHFKLIWCHSLKDVWMNFQTRGHITATTAIHSVALNFDWPFEWCCLQIGVLPPLAAFCQQGHHFADALAVPVDLLTLHQGHQRQGLNTAATLADTTTWC